MRAPELSYERRKQAYERLRQRQQRAANRLSNFRAAVFVVGFVAIYWLYRAIDLWAALAVGLVTLVGFTYLALQHQTVRARFKSAETLAELNERGLQRLSGEWVDFRRTGQEFAEAEHAYASDLDLFGQASLFQWTNSAETPEGQATLAEWLKHPQLDPTGIFERQLAVTELAGRLAWRQRLQAAAMLVADKLESAAPLLQWAKQVDHELPRLFRLVVRVLPVITLLILALYALGAPVPWSLPVLLAAVQLIMLRLNSKRRTHTLSLVESREAGLRTYAAMLVLLEQLDAEAVWLRRRQAGLRDSHGRSASEQLRRLSVIAERIANRRNPLFVIVNVLTLWDYQCLIALAEWKRESGRLLATWLRVLAEVEAVASLANIRFEHPNWAMPEVAIQQEASGLRAKNLCHPLLLQGVANDFALGTPARVVLITGSNMSGKSTFLRAVGCNLVLAYAGAPVCAAEFRCSLMRLWTCMRVSDNLEQSISSFYAEILRIKRILQAASAGQSICFLLDEIFKGTNSHDRHLGARALISQLQRDGAYGLVSTHDLELGDLEQSSGGEIRNYHFREYYQDSEIRFDYKLRSGLSTTRNALHLIRMAGIELEEPS